MANDEHDGASVQEQLIEACRRNNTELLEELLEAAGSDEEISRLLNTTTTVMGDYLYHVAAAQGHYDIIDMLLDQPAFECDPVNRAGNTPLHTAIQWLNSEPAAQRPFGNALIKMMLEAGSNWRLRTKAGLAAEQLVDPSNSELREIIREHEYAEMNQGDFVDVDSGATAAETKVETESRNVSNGHSVKPPPVPGKAAPSLPMEGGDDGEFSGSDEEERAEWLRRKGRR
ncbi:Ankyrin repeat-containing protein [Ceratocystis platani]|uniref:Ankyrin repeat-containing protein n=1 Tax=Ceratocystis fimbriata f. sp. platani TaxID=88771 RepID=A0A0F8DJ45_CERFI|nr:Ankyrin repeat-containing protein [Ceratocystis platani]